MNTNRKLNLFFGLLISLSMSGCGQTASQFAATFTPSSTLVSPVVLVPTQKAANEDAQRGATCNKIAFVLAKGNQSDIFSACPDGSDIQNLTNSPDFNSTPAWSPDGERIAFSSSRTGIPQIFVMNADGSNAIQFTFDHQNDYPIWLPGGEKIAFRTTDGKGLWWWRVMNIQTSEITQFSEPVFDFFYQTPAWSPDGQRIAYMSLFEQEPRNDGSSQIHVKNLNGSNDRALTNDTWANINPIWSPDGKEIAFLSERDGVYNSFALYVMEADGQNVRKLTNPIFSENCKFSWAPDGAQIAIDSDIQVGKTFIIDIISGQMSQFMPIIDGQRAFFPAWQP